MLGDSSRPCHCWLLHAQPLPLNRDESQIENWQGCMDPSYNTFFTEDCVPSTGCYDPGATMAAAYATAVTTYNMGSGSSYVPPSSTNPFDFLDAVAGTCTTMPAPTDTPVTPAGRYTGEGGGKGMMGEGGGKGMGGGEGGSKGMGGGEGGSKGMGGGEGGSKGMGGGEGGSKGMGGGSKGMGGGSGKGEGGSKGEGGRKGHGAQMTASFASKGNAYKPMSPPPHPPTQRHSLRQHRHQHLSCHTPH